IPIAFDERGVRIYEVAPVADARIVVANVGGVAAPTRAIDEVAVAEYVKRIASGRAATALEPHGLGAWRAQVDVRDGEQVILRQAYDTGWHATVDGRATTVRADPIGQPAVDVPPGQPVVELDHR